MSKYVILIFKSFLEEAAGRIEGGRGPHAARGPDFGQP